MPQRRSRKIRRRMLVVGARLISERGLQAARIVDIVQDAHASIGVFYHRFGDKQGLLDALKADRSMSAQRAIRRYFRSLGEAASATDVLQGLVVRIDAAVRRRRNLIAALLAGCGGAVPDDGAWQALEQALAEALWDWQVRHGARGDAAGRARCRMSAVGLLRMVTMPALTDPAGKRRIDPQRARVIVALHQRYLAAGQGDAGH